jgi:hypothetical protein
MSADSLTVGDLLLLRQLAAVAAPAYLGDPPGVGERIDALGNARRRALAFLDPETLRQVQALDRDICETAPEEAELRSSLIEKHAELLALPCGAPPPERAAPPPETPETPLETQPAGG